MQEEGIGVVRWQRWTIDRMVWSHSAALMFLQGCPLLPLVHPHLILAARVRPAFAPRPGLDDVVLATVFEDAGLDHFDLFRRLVPYARG